MILQLATASRGGWLTLTSHRVALEALDFSMWMEKDVGWALVCLTEKTGEVAVAKRVKAQATI
jgi:hypothetical protein